VKGCTHYKRRDEDGRELARRSAPIGPPAAIGQLADALGKEGGT